VLKKSIFILLICVCYINSNAQFLMDMIDTTTEMGKGMLSIYQKFDRVKLSGYMQPQFQIAAEKGTKSFDGGDFPSLVNNRFMLRRGRVKIEYVHYAEHRGPSVQFVFQFDGSERGFFTRDFWGRVLENKYQLFSLTAGLFARPISYELNLSSGDRESPERGRMSQLLMRTERDLGVMASFEPRKKGHPLRFLKVDAGLFNGPGLAATTDFDSHKDFISRVSLKPVPVRSNVFLSSAVSYFNGGFIQNTKYVYHTERINNEKIVLPDSSLTNVGRIAPRKYYGADAQLKIRHPHGTTEFRAEMMTGTQTASLNSNETPFALFNANEGYYVRKFNGAYFYILQNIVSPQHQVVLKYDWYDPNSKVAGREIGKEGSHLTATDIKYSTLGMGYLYYINENLKLVLWYEHVTNEKTALPGYTSDIKDDVFTCRLQFKF
jgi:hypothetical protein